MTTLLGVDFAEYIFVNINPYVLIHFQNIKNCVDISLIFKYNKSLFKKISNTKHSSNQPWQVRDHLMEK